MADAPAVRLGMGGVPSDAAIPDAAVTVPADPTVAASAATAVGRDPERLYRELAPAVLGYLRSQGALEPEDLLGDVFVAVVKGARRVRGDDAAVRRWVFTIAHHRLVDERRRRRHRRAATPEQQAAAWQQPAGDESGTGPDPELLAALGALTPEQRQVIGLRVVADLPVRDVARVLRKRPDAVKALHHRATVRLAATLGGDVSDR